MTSLRALLHDPDLDGTWHSPDGRATVTYDRQVLMTIHAQPRGPDDARARADRDLSRLRRTRPPRPALRRMPNPRRSMTMARHHPRRKSLRDIRLSTELATIAEQITRAIDRAGRPLHSEERAAIAQALGRDPNSDRPT